MTSDEANVVLDLLVTASPRSEKRWGERVLEYGRLARAGGPLPDVARALSSLYAEPAPGAPQYLMIDRLERVLFPRLASALAISEGRVRERVHREHRLFVGEAPYREETERPLPLAPTPSGWEFFGAFRVLSRELVLDEDPANPNATTVTARNGVWFVWQRERPPSLLERLLSNEPSTQYVVCHQDVASEVEQRALRTPHQWRHSVEGGRAGVVDAEVRTDRRALADFEHGEAVQTRGAMLGLGGDGTAVWRGAKQADEVILLTLDVDEE